MAHVFISYHQESDSDFVASLERGIRKAGYEVWTDGEVEAGHAWQEKIDTAIRDAFALVVVLSPASLGSAYVAYEWAFALGAGLRVIPIRCKVEVAKLHERLRAFDVLDFSASSDKARPWADLLEALRSAAQEALDPARTLAKGTSDAVRAAARALDSVREEERDAALQSLEQMTDPAANDVLANALAHPVVAVRHRASVLLARKGDARAIDTLVELLRTNDWDLSGTRDEARNAFRKLKADAIPKLVELSGDSKADVREAAVIALGVIGDVRALESLIHATRDVDEDVRCESLSALARFPNEQRALAAVIDRSEDTDKSVRRAAALALGDFHNPEALPHIARLVNDPDVRQAAVQALGNSGMPGAVEILAAAMDSDDDDFRMWCANALKDLATPEAASQLVRALGDRFWVVRRRALEGLENIPGSAGTVALIAALETPGTLDRGPIVTAIASRGDASAIPALLAALDRTTEKGERAKIVCALGELRAESAAARLVQFLGDADSDLVAETRRALDRIGTPEARRALAELRAKGQ